jgi:hypothetical protein
VRPLYESNEDLDREWTAVFEFCEYSKTFPVKLPIGARADYLLCRKRDAVAVVEVKCRKNKRHTYPTYMLSKSKYDALCEYTEMGLHAVLLVRWEDDIGYVSIPAEHEVATGGRTDRNDPLDVEKVVLIDINKFKLI